MCMEKPRTPRATRAGGGLPKHRKRTGLELNRRPKPNQERDCSKKEHEIQHDFTFALGVVIGPTITDVSKKHSETNYEGSSEKRENHE